MRKRDEYIDDVQARCASFSRAVTWAADRLKDAADTVSRGAERDPKAARLLSDTFTATDDVIAEFKTGVLPELRALVTFAAVRFEPVNDAWRAHLLPLVAKSVLGF